MTLAYNLSQLPLSINGVVIGNTTPAAGTFTTVSAASLAGGAASGTGATGTWPINVSGAAATAANATNATTAANATAVDTAGAGVNLNASRWNLSASGYSQNLGNTQPAFMARVSGIQATGNVAIFGIIDRQNGSSYNATTGSFTVPVTGWYAFAFGIQFSNPVGQPTQTVFAYLYNVSNTNIYAATTNYSLPAGSAIGVSASGIFFFAANTVLQVRVFPTLGVNMTLTGGYTCSFQGVLLF